MKKHKNIYLLAIIICLTSFVGAQINYNQNLLKTDIQLTGEDYITGEDGVPRKSVNIWGHVSRPGAYLVYDGIDILTCLSMAGGPLKGANLSKVSIISEDGSSKKVDLKSMLDKNNISSIKLKPHDTIYIDQTMSNYLLLRTGFINTLLQLANLIITINN